MENDPETFLNPRLLAMYIAGWLLIGLGIAKFVSGIEVVPAQWRFEHYEIVMMVVGGLLAGPFQLHINRLMQRREDDRPR